MPRTVMTVPEFRAKLEAIVAEINDTTTIDLLHDAVENVFEAIKDAKPNAFDMPLKISNELCEFLGLQPDSSISRYDVTEQIHNYVVENGLNNNTIIVPDAKLKALLNTQDQVTYFNLQRLIKPHYVN